MDARGAQRNFLGTSKIFACPANPAIPPWYLDFSVTLATTFEHTDRCILGVLSENSRHLEKSDCKHTQHFRQPGPLPSLLPSRVVHLDQFQVCSKHESRIAGLLWGVGGMGEAPRITITNCNKSQLKAIRIRQW